MKNMVISGARMEDEIFSNHVGTWNVSKAKRDCAKGRHGSPFLIDLDEAVLSANAAVDVDEEKVLHFLDRPMILAQPLLMMVEGEGVWLVDGHHRLRALAMIGASDFLAYVIEAEFEPEYRVLFNGKRILPSIQD